MATLRVRGKKNIIYIRFMFANSQREERTPYVCTGANPNTCTKCKGHIEAGKLKLDIESALIDGTFKYDRFFNNSSVLERHLLMPNITFEVYSEIWLSEQKYEYSTMVGVKKILKNNLLPYFKDYTLKEINKNKVEKFIINLQNKGLKNSSIKHILTYLGSIMISAVRDEIIENNPVSNVKRPKIESVEVDTFTLDEIYEIIEYCKDYYPKNTLYYMIGFFMGLRTGEIVALKWTDFDFDKKILVVQRNVFNNHVKESTKTAPLRKIAIPPILDEYIEFHKQFKDETDWVFPGKVTIERPMNRRSFEDIWVKILKALRLEYRRMYSMRHSYATNSLNAGIPVNHIKHTLGHKTLSMIMKVYGNSVDKVNTRIGLNFNNVKKKKH